MAVNGLNLLTSNGKLEARIGDMINLSAKACNKRAFGTAIPLKKYTGALSDSASFNVFKTKAEAAGFDKAIIDRMTAYVEKMVMKLI